jgi:hypothetical protein
VAGSESVPFGDPNALRAAIEETLTLARIQAELGEGFAAIRDDVGLAYAVRRLTAYTRAAVDLAADLAEAKQRRAGHEG